MQKVDRDKFLFAIQGPLGPFSDSQKEALSALLDCLESDNDMADLSWCAYALATSYWETGKTFRPIEEYGKGAGHSYGVPDSVTGQAYYGRGFIQMTWKSNYMQFGKTLGIDLVNHPELALQPDVAYKIMSTGMRHGSFTGVGLAKYFNDTMSDAVNARKIINGLDQAERIAGYYADILKALQESQTV